MKVDERFTALVEAHTQKCGGVQARWLAEELDAPLDGVEAALRDRGYEAVDEPWFLPPAATFTDEAFTATPFYRALALMFACCGPLSIEDICGGVRRAASDTRFPVPPPAVMARILGYFSQPDDEGLYGWDVTLPDDALSPVERLLLDYFDENPPVAQYSELTPGAEEAGFSLTALRSALKDSPLFDRIDIGLYKVRGELVKARDIARAERATQRVLLKPEITYDRTGKITIDATVGVTALRRGEIYSSQFPNLSGTWDCRVEDAVVGELDATVDTFRHLSEPFEALGCEVGDRLRFIFNTWDRTVTLESLTTKGQVQDEQPNN